MVGVVDGAGDDGSDIVGEDEGIVDENVDGVKVFFLGDGGELSGKDTRAKSGNPCGELSGDDTGAKSGVDVGRTVGEDS